MASVVSRALVLAAAGSSPAFAAWDLNMPRGVTDLSVKIYDLHMLIFWVCVVIAVAVFGVMIYSIWRFRKSQGAVADTRLTHSTKVEMIWTIVPVIILVAMAVPAARTLIEIEDMRDTELTIKVTGYQWRWQYTYLAGGAEDSSNSGTEVSFFSSLGRSSDAARQLGSGVDPKTVENYLLDVDHPLVIPAGKKVHLLLTANDVIHAWWVPDFGMKKDAVPGMVNDFWIRVAPGTTGMFRGQCAELCGRDHAFMPIVVDVKSPEDFDAWLKARQDEAKQAAAPQSAPSAESVAKTRAASGDMPAANLAQAN